jgi:hypothetical protein
MNEKISETVSGLNGEKVTRVKTSLIHQVAYALILIGFLLVFFGALFGYNRILEVGFFLLITAVPFLFLYPVIRFVIGGRDSLFGIVLTMLVEHGIKKKMNFYGKRKR